MGANPPDRMETILVSKFDDIDDVFRIWERLLGDGINIGLFLVYEDAPPCRAIEVMVNWPPPFVVFTTRPLMLDYDKEEGGREETWPTAETAKIFCSNILKHVGNWPPKEDEDVIDTLREIDRRSGYKRERRIERSDG